jgi:hypothetical protein
MQSGAKVLHALRGLLAQEARGASPSQVGCLTYFYRKVKSEAFCKIVLMVSASFSTLGG